MRLFGISTRSREGAAGRLPVGQAMGFRRFPPFSAWISTVVILAVCVLGAGTGHAAVETKARNAILIDMNARSVLFEKAPEERISPASMAKLMTLAVVFKALADGEITEETTYPISEHAWRTGGAPSRTSTMFAELGSDVRVIDLIRGIIVQSANDACIAIAEGMAGSEEAFARRMNALAAELGLSASHFGNPTGLPDTVTRVSVQDLATLGMHLIDTYPNYYPIFSEEQFTWNKILQRNRNPLFGTDIDADGLKTGYTEEAGYGMVASAVRDGRRLLLVVAGLETASDRESEALKLLSSGYEDFRPITIFELGEIVGEARVFGGTKGTAMLVPHKDIITPMPVEDAEGYRLRVVYQGPLRAPVKKGAEVGALTIYRDKKLVQSVPLYTGEDIGVGDLQQRALDGAVELLIGWW